MTGTNSLHLFALAAALVVTGCNPPPATLETADGSSSEADAPDGEDPNSECEALVREVCGLRADGTLVCGGSYGCELALMTQDSSPEMCAERRSGLRRLEPCNDLAGGRSADCEGCGATSNNAPMAPQESGLDGGTGVAVRGDDASAGLGGAAQAICGELQHKCCGQESNGCQASQVCALATEVARANHAQSCYEALGDEAAFPRCAN